MWNTEHGLHPTPISTIDEVTRLEHVSTTLCSIDLCIQLPLQVFQSFEVREISISSSIRVVEVIAHPSLMHIQPSSIDEFFDLIYACTIRDCESIDSTVPLTRNFHLGVSETQKGPSQM